MKFFILTLLLFSLNAHAEPPKTVDFVDIHQYAGRWFEIASIPQWFEKGCVNSTADYSLRTDGKIDVVNSCFENNLNGKHKISKGVAKIVDPQTNSKLKVSFFRPFWGDYWIVDLDPQYRYAVVSNSKMSSLWILNRQQRMDPQVYDGIIKKLKLRGFDLSQLIAVPQIETPLKN